MEEENSTKFDEALNEKIYETMNNLYGPETTEKFEEEKTKLQEKIVELTEKIEKNDLDETDKFARQKAELQLQTYVFEYELLDYIINKIAEFAPQE